MWHRRWSAQLEASRPETGRPDTPAAHRHLPDRIERTVVLGHPPERVWQALTTAEGLGTWFGQSAEIDLRVGGQAKLTWSSGDTATLTIERLEAPRVFGYTWGIYGLPDEDPRRTYVEFTLEPTRYRRHPDRG